MPPEFAPTSPLDWPTARMLFAMGVPLELRWTPGINRSIRWGQLSPADTYWFALTAPGRDTHEVECRRA